MTARRTLLLSPSLHALTRLLFQAGSLRGRRSYAHCKLVDDVGLPERRDGRAIQRATSVTFDRRMKSLLQGGAAWHLGCPERLGLSRWRPTIFAV